MSRRNLINARLMAGASLALIGFLTAGSALAAASGPMTGAGAEGTEVADVIVTAERSPAAAAAPAKASLEETQPEAIISHQFIEQVTPEAGGWTTVVTIAPSMSGISSNGGGVGDYNVVTLRGLPDGDFNITYDGISFGDTNNPTHHGGDYWPASTIGAAVVDRGPGAAGDLGQANYGGAIHYFSPVVSDQFGVDQKVTYGSFDSEDAVTTVNTGYRPELAGGKLLLNFEERWSAGELSHSNGDLFNQLLKYELPIGNKGTLTLFGSHQWTRFNFEDSEGPGETWRQTLLHGKNFYMTGNPDSEHYYGFNYEKKQTDFEYIDLKYAISTRVVALEEQPYTYFYSNKTLSSNDLTGLVGGPNTSPPMAKGANQNDIGGYNKLNEYRVYGDVLRLNQDWSFGTLKVGGLVESSHTDRHNFYEDFTNDFAPDNKYTTPTYYRTTNDKLLETSHWLQGQIFVDFNWRPIDNLTISPGFKYVDFHRSVDAMDENVGGGSKNQPLYASNTYSSPLYFVTANYKILPDLAIYGQFATSFLIPPLSALYTAGASLQQLRPETTTTYQAGVVYTHGDITADTDVYRIDAQNNFQTCVVPDPTPAAPNATDTESCNFGDARYTGVEGEAAYHFDVGVTLFANGSLNSAKQLANTANPAQGITANPAQTLANAPKSTAAVGAIYHHGPWAASLTYKDSGPFVNYNGPTRFHLPGYDAFDASLAYDFGHFRIKLQGFNLLDKRSITTFTPGGTSTTLYQTVDPGGALDTSIYTYQEGRDLSVTLEAKF